MQSSNVQRKESPEILYEGREINAVKRNPYLVDFEGHRRQRTGVPQSRQARRPSGTLQAGPEQNRRRQAPGGNARRSPVQGQYRQEQLQPEQGLRRPARTQRSQELWDRERDSRSIQNRKRPVRPADDWEEEEMELNLAPRRQINRSAALARRRKKVLMQRALAGVWVLCIFVLIASLIFKNSRVSAGEGDEAGQGQSAEGGETPQYSGYMVQGIPAEEYAKHPEWTEDFLTVNEYSRPGDPLESVKNIFVHYTANPGTSAAQNRSYFEWLKDTHETSASAHFIIGYEGEIIQCVPLNEIAYAVQSRNGDSISIECCYLKADGSFTQETYDSLLSLLAWLKNTYHLETDDILRHYDCGGKKCPLYYTDHPDAWEELKKDVDKL